MSDPRSRSSEDGAGALLGLAAADQLAAFQLPAGRTGALYGFRTQQATIVAYHLMRWGEVRADVLQAELIEMAFSEEGPSAYRDEPEWFRRLLDESDEVEAAQAGDGAAPLALPIGIWYRWDVQRLVTETLEVASVTHRDALSLAAAGAFSGSVAAASFGQHGQDFLNAVGEFASRSVSELPKRGITDAAGARSFLAALGEAGRWRESRPTEVIEACLKGTGSAGNVIAAIVLGAVPTDASEEAVRAAAGFRDVAPLLGAIVGARRGVAHWPWDMPNELWFAEIGRRLARQSRVFRDLPDPYAVEITLVDPTWVPHGIF